MSEANDVTNSAGVRSLCSPTAHSGGVKHPTMARLRHELTDAVRAEWVKLESGARRRGS